MNRFLLILATATAVMPAASVAAPVVASFAALPLSDDGLAAIHGTGMGEAGFVSRAARDQSEAFNRFTGETVSVTFDNWFADVGDALIVANQLR